MALIVVNRGPELRVRAPAGLPEGASVTVVVRAQRVQVGPPENPQPNRLSGTVPPPPSSAARPPI